MANRKRKRNRNRNRKEKEKICTEESSQLNQQGLMMDEQEQNLREKKA